MLGFCGAGVLRRWGLAAPGRRLRRPFIAFSRCRDMSMWSRVRNVFRRDLNDHIDAELPSHFDDAQAAGRDPFEVRRAFGSRLRVREATRDVIVAVWVESLLQD